MEKVIELLKEIQERAFESASDQKRRGEKQGQYLVIARKATDALKLLKVKA